MAAAATNFSGFPLFSSLAPELRNQIWRGALPNKVGPTLYAYKRGCWCPRHFAESDFEYDSNGSNLIIEWRHDLLEDVQFQIPLVFVNREARGIALDWIREQGIEIRSRNGQQPVFARSFDLTCDALYVPLNKWEDFLCDPVDRIFQPDFEDQYFGTGTELERLAVPEELLRSEHAATLHELFQYFFNLKVLLIIVDTQPDLQSPNNNIKVQQRWEFESAQRGAFFWDHDRGGFDFGDGERVGDETLYKLIEEVIDKSLNEALHRESFIRSFEIRPAFAVRR